MNKETLNISIDGMYRALIVRENILQSLWQHRFKYVYKGRDRTLRFYRKAAKIIKEIKRLRKIIFEMTYILSYL